MTCRKSILIIILCLSALLSVQCKKSPTVPNADILNRPIIWLNSFEFTFAASISGGNPANQILQIKNTGKEPLSYKLSSDAAWVSIAEESGTSTGQIINHNIIIDKTGMPAQETPHTATLTIEGAEAYNNPQKVTISLMLSTEPPPTIQINPQKLTFTGQVNGANPASQNFNILNTGGGTLKFDITANKPWLSVDPNSGQSRSNQKTIKVSINTNGLGEGTYNGRIDIKDPNATNSPKSVNVTLNMSKTTPPEISVQPNRLDFLAFIGGSNPSSQNLYVSNSGEGTLKYAIDWNESWLNVNPNGGTSSGAENRHTVSVNASGLTVGTYNGTISISDPNATNSPVVVNVSLTVRAPLTDNKVGVSLSPNSGPTGTIVSVPITVTGNTSQLEAFGLQLNFNTTMFEYVGTLKGNLTGSWALVDGNQTSPGVVTIGGFAGAGTPVPIGSLGTIAVVRLRVTCSSCSNNQTSQVSISGFSDDLVGMSASPASATFTYKQ